jgi:hypothetical protein
VQIQGPNRLVYVLKVHACLKEELL